jgi:hypothetical protein
VPGLRLNEHIEWDGPTVFAHACKLELEGIVSKRRHSHYRSGRSPDWIKSKNPAAPAGFRTMDYCMDLSAQSHGGVHLRSKVFSTRSAADRIARNGHLHAFVVFVAFSRPLGQRRPISVWRHRIPACLVAGGSDQCFA